MTGQVPFGATALQRRKKEKAKSPNEVEKKKEKAKNLTDVSTVNQAENPNDADDFETLVDYEISRVKSMLSWQDNNKP